MNNLNLLNKLFEKTSWLRSENDIACHFFLSFRFVRAGKTKNQHEQSESNLSRRIDARIILFRRNFHVAPCGHRCRCVCVRAVYARSSRHTESRMLFSSRSSKIYVYNFYSNFLLIMRRAFVSFRLLFCFLSSFFRSFLSARALFFVFSILFIYSLKSEMLMLAKYGEVSLEIVRSLCVRWLFIMKCGRLDAVTSIARSFLYCGNSIECAPWRLTRKIYSPRFRFSNLSESSSSQNEWIYWKIIINEEENETERKTEKKKKSDDTRYQCRAEWGFSLLSRVR